MHVPRAWARAASDPGDPSGPGFPVSVWGWGEDERSARAGAQDRLRRVLERLRLGETGRPDEYGYGKRPLREEILQTLGGSAPDEQQAVVTRNRYGAQVLNAARLLFLDVDVKPPGLLRRALRGFGGGRSADEAVSTLRDALRRHGGATFRLYRTAAGLRAVAVDREYDPTGPETGDLMEATGTDPAFARLCLAQRSFRARLTPKPWRCRLPPPPGSHPRTDEEERRRFDDWLGRYEEACMSRATCRYIETIGGGSPRGDARALIELHDRVTRCDTALPLA